MKSNGNLRKAADAFGPEDTLRKAAKLAPAKKNGKEKRSFYRELDDDEESSLGVRPKPDSTLHYYDDEEDEAWYDDDESDLDEEWDENGEEWEDEPSDDDD